MNNKVFLLLFIFGFIFNASSQHDVNFYGTKYSDQEIDTFPTYSGGYLEFMDYVSFNFRVNQSMKNQIGEYQQSVIFTFVIDTSGNTHGLQIRNCASSFVQKEFEKVFANMTGWQPGVHNGEKVAMQVDLMFDFNIENMQLNAYPQNSFVVSPKERGKRPVIKVALITLALSIPILAIIATEKK